MPTMGAHRRRAARAARFRAGWRGLDVLATV